jgi:hypothetical protein
MKGVCGENHGAFLPIAQGVGNFKSVSRGLSGEGEGESAAPSQVMDTAVG